MELEIDIKLSNGNPGKYDPDKKAVTRSFNFGLPWDSRDHEGEMRLIEAVSASVNFADIIGMMCEELNEQDFPEDEAKQELTREGEKFVDALISSAGATGTEDPNYPDKQDIVDRNEEQA
jgi:hypothetical protein